MLILNTRATDARNSRPIGPRDLTWFESIITRKRRNVLTLYNLKNLGELSAKTLSPHPPTQYMDRPLPIDGGKSIAPPVLLMLISRPRRESKLPNSPSCSGSRKMLSFDSTNQLASPFITVLEIEVL